jgi:hypothetical protein
MNHKIRHKVVGLERLRQLRVVPEDMGQRVEDNQSPINSRTQQGAVQVRRTTQYISRSLEISSEGGSP